MPGVCGAGGSPSLRARQDLHQLSYMLCSKSIFLSALIGNDSHTAHSWLCFLSRKAFWKVSPSVSAWRPQTLLIREYQTCIFCLCFHLPRSSHWSHWSNSSIHNKTSKFCWIIDKTMVAEMPVFFFFLHYTLFCSKDSFDFWRRMQRPQKIFTSQCKEYRERQERIKMMGQLESAGSVFLVGFLAGLLNTLASPS